MLKLVLLLDEDDKSLLKLLNYAYKMFIKLKIKYFDNNLTKNYKLIREFYNYKLINNKTINHAFTHFKQLYQKLIAINNKIKIIYTVDYAYSQLLTALFNNYNTI